MNKGASSSLATTIIVILTFKYLWQFNWNEWFSFFLLCVFYIFVSSDIQDKIGVVNDATVYAVYNYDAMKSDELSVQNGSKLIVLRKGDNEEKEWWWCRINATDGYVPQNFLAVSYLFVLLSHGCVQIMKTRLKEHKKNVGEVRQVFQIDITRYCWCTRWICLHKCRRRNLRIWSRQHITFKTMIKSVYYVTYTCL